MIPVRLYMRNFMCYREQELDFGGIHLACLSGNNGHGKSAILDALTWALWGRSRVGARRDDELIHLGQKEMEVEFAFNLTDGSSGRSDGSTDGTRYRVLRKRTRGRGRKSGRSSLELQGWDPAEGRYRSLSEPTISATQAKIDGLLRMDYDTFINSAFLLQGRADEFTVKRPAERKRVLGDILGLQIYDQYEALAKEAAQAARAQADQLLAAIEQMDTEIAREPEYRETVQVAERELERVRQARTEIEAEHERTRQALHEAQAARTQLADLQQRLQKAKEQIEKARESVQAHQERLTALEEAIAHRDEIEARYAAFQQAVADNEKMNARLAQLVSLNERRSAHESAIAEARHRLEVERRAAADSVEQLALRAQAGEQEAELRAVREALECLQGRASEREELVEERQSLAQEVARLKGENERAKQDAQQIHEKIALLEARPSTGAREHGGPDERARCPLCDQPLEEGDRARLLASFEATLEEERAAYRERTAQVRAHQQRIQEIDAAISAIDREMRTLGGLQRKEAALAHAVEEARAAAEALPEAQETLHAIEARLREQDYAAEEGAALEEIERQLGELGYDADAHHQIQETLEAMRDSEADMQTLREADANIETIKLAIEQLAQSLEQAEAGLAADREQADRLKEKADREPELRRQEYEMRQKLEQAHDREQQASLRLGAARNKVEYCADLRAQRARRVCEEQERRAEQGVYEELRRAFGRNGVQAMIIESAIPEIEREANHLLARMTRGSMHVLFDTQRSSKAGATIETLDIHITDPLGTRRYETYSGGERYRIDFAIRIALSKLLARRAGAQLQMLVIDEGFGTQDVEGRDGLVDAINAVQDDFACILAITHIDELKDAFNVRIDVEKTPQGSQISIR